MLTILAAHSKVDMTIKVHGDLEVDGHTVEDVGIALGQAFEQALGAKGNSSLRILYSADG